MGERNWGKKMGTRKKLGTQYIFTYFPAKLTMPYRVLVFLFHYEIEKLNGYMYGFFRLKVDQTNGNKHPKTPTCPHFFGQITGRPG